MIETITLPRSTSAPRLARRWAHERLNPLGLEPVRHENVVLAISELVTNAVRHAASAPTLTLRVTSGRLHISVEDSSPTEPMMRPPDPPGGWGLKIVDDIADEWGFTHLDGSKLVWFTLATAARNP